MHKQTVLYECTYIISFLTRHNESINDDKNDALYTSTYFSLAQFKFCWWHRNRLMMTSQWRHYTSTWKVISNLLDIDFIHGDIHGRSCKNFLCINLASMLFHFMKSLQPSDTIWWHRSELSLAQVMAFCLTAPSHYLNQCRLIIKDVLWHSPEGNFTRNT